MAGEHTSGGGCGSIGFNAGNLTRGDGSMRVRLKVLPDKPRAAAWPSSARIVRRAVKSVNERDPHHMLLIFCPQEMHSCETAGDKPEEGVGDGRSVWRELSGLHAAYNACHNGMRLRKEEQIP